MHQSPLRMDWFQHTAARRRLLCYSWFVIIFTCFNTQPPEGGCVATTLQSLVTWVSTHSRPKAADGSSRRLSPLRVCFNTQPPEGGCIRQPSDEWCLLVSTHSRPKAAGAETEAASCTEQGFNTQPPEGGCEFAFPIRYEMAVSTHSRPKAAGFESALSVLVLLFQHTAARRRLFTGC